VPLILSKERPRELIDLLYYVPWGDILEFTYDGDEQRHGVPCGMSLFLYLVVVVGYVMLDGNTLDMEKTKAKKMLETLGSGQGFLHSFLNHIAAKEFSWLQEDVMVPLDAKRSDEANRV